MENNLGDNWEKERERERESTILVLSSYSLLGYIRFFLLLLFFFSLRFVSRRRDIELLREPIPRTLRPQCLKGGVDTASYTT